MFIYFRKISQNFLILSSLFIFSSLIFCEAVQPDGVGVNDVNSDSSSSQNVVLPLLENTDPLHPVIALCASCHGAEGISHDNQSIPNLAGQYPRYLYKQLETFSKGDEGDFPSSVMVSFAQSLSDQEKKLISKYYGKLPRSYQETSSAANISLGRRIYLGGVFEKKIPACSSCHSPTGFGNEPAGYPALAGQNAEYLIAQLNNYKSSERKNKIMNAVAHNLTEPEIEAIAYYLQGLRSKPLH